MKGKDQNKKPSIPLGEFVRMRRELRGLSATEAALLAGLDRTYWLRVEAGEYATPNPKYLERIAKIIKASPVDLYVLAGYKLGGDLPGFGPYLRSKYHLPPEAIEQLELYFEFMRAQYGIDDDQPVFPPKPKDQSTKDQSGGPLRRSA